MPRPQPRPRRWITATLRNDDDDIEGVVGDWGTATRDEVVSDIHNSLVDYVLRSMDGETTTVQLVEGRTATFLMANQPGQLHNHLDDLPRQH
jgi:hypothetical protein